MAGLNIKYSLMLGLFLLVGCPDNADGPPPVENVPEETTPDSGEELFKDKSCRNCHASYSQVCPSLVGFSERALIAGKVPNTRENLQKWLKDPFSIKYGTRMPKIHLTDIEINLLIDYIYTL